MKVYHSSRLKTAAGAVLGAAFAYGGGFLLDKRPLLAWAAMLFFGAVALAAIANLLTGGTTLTLGRKGFELSSWFQRKRVRWDEIEPLQVGAIKKTKLVAVNYLPATGKQTLSRSMTGADLAIANHFSVPLQELCDTMNEYRSRFLAVRGADPARDSAPLPAEEAPAEARPARVVPIACCAALAVLVMNVLLRVVLKLEGMYVTLGIAFGVGTLVMAWFLKVLKRAPSAAERTRFLWIYSALVVVPYLGLYLLGSANRGGFNGWALAVLGLHSLAYAAGAQVMLTPRKLAAILPGKA